MSAPIPVINEALSCICDRPQGVPHSDLCAIAARHGLGAGSLVDAIRQTGFMLEFADNHWRLAVALQPHVTASLERHLGRMGVELCYQPVTGSTNADALQDDFDLSPRLHLTEYQFRGRGQKGRHWHARPFESLLFSLSLPWPQVPNAALEPANVTLQAGLLLRAALPEHARGRVRIKWPNDLVVGHDKLAGILTELRQQGRRARLVIGVGMNVHGTPEVSKRDTIALAALVEKLPDRDELLMSCVNALLELTSGGAALGECWSPEIDALWGRRVTCADGREGLGTGLAPDGGYRIRAGNRELVLSGADSILAWR